VWPVVSACTRLEYLGLHFESEQASDNKKIDELKKEQLPLLPASLRHLWLYYADEQAVFEIIF
jgi:hypothetical protein